MSRKADGVAVEGGRRLVIRNRTNESKSLTISIGSSLPEDFIKGITALAIKEIGVHAQLVQSVSGTRVFA